MKYSLVLVALLSAASLSAAPRPMVVTTAEPVETTVETETVSPVTQTVVAPVTTTVQRATPQVAQSQEQTEVVLPLHSSIVISVTGQGVAPMNTSSPAQAYALAKRAAVADAYRLIAERVRGVRVDGQDLIKNMMVKRSTVRTSVQAIVRNANIVETTFKEGLCEVEMEITLSHSQFQ
jgi:hypothetical protein